MPVDVIQIKFTGGTAGESSLFFWGAGADLPLSWVEMSVYLEQLDSATRLAVQDTSRMANFLQRCNLVVLSAISLL